jgi:hypothetical protein
MLYAVGLTAVVAAAALLLRRVLVERVVVFDYQRAVLYRAGAGCGRSRPARTGCSAGYRR